MINKIKVPSDEDDARIIAAAESDPDARPWTAEELAKIKRAKFYRSVLTKTSHIPKD